MSVNTIVSGIGVPNTLTNPLTATTGTAFTPVVTMIDPATAKNGEPIGWTTLQNKPFTVRASGTWFCNSGTTPSLTAQIYLGGIAGTQVATTGAVQVGVTQPSSGVWYIEGRYMWDSVSGINGMYWGFVSGTNSVASSPARNMFYVNNVAAATYPTNVTFTATGLFSATGSTNTVTLTEFVITYV